ncbi:helix-turn-helix transcriptional regulator [Comamonas aquatica]|uniref:Helix-turn-helix domain-containing protein n=1 Tax=Comamonas aquatica TaxID=225991 RepID=A0AA42L872_9BURK|nr:hypothetical protein [Comamonas aquatica]MDH0364216.1 hypothetical protein [Comamonas aquatica]
MNCTTTPATTTHSTMASSVPRLDTAGIAALLGCTRQHVTSRVTKRVDFPRPYINVSRRIRYWRTSDVRAWMQKGGI